MSARGASFWYRTAEALLLALVFLLPISFYLRTYECATIKTTTLQLGVLALVFAWILKGVERGRWEVPAGAWPLLAPALALLGWILLRFALAPHKLAAIDGFLYQILCLATYCVAVLEFGGTDTARRLADWLTGASWIATLYGLCQVLGWDPLLWKGAFGDSVFSTLANPDKFGLFLAACLPLVLARQVDAERHAALKALDLALLVLLSANAAWTGSAEGVAAFVLAAAITAASLPLLFPSKATWKVSVLAGAIAVATLSAALGRSGAAFERSALHETEFKRHAWAATLRMAAQHPLTGFGPGSFNVHFPRFRPPEIIRLEGWHNGMTVHAENQLLELAAESGLVGAGLWTWLFGALMLATWRACGRFLKEGAEGERLYAAGLAATVAGLLVSFQFSLGGLFPAPGWLLWAFAGVLGGLTMLSERGKVATAPIPLAEPERMRLYAPALAAFAFLAFYPAAWFRSDVRLNMGIAFYKAGSMDWSTEAFDRVRPGAPAYVMAQYFKGNALREAGRPEEALRQYAAVEALAPDYVLLHYFKALAYAGLRDWENAVKSHERQRELDPLYVENYLRWSQAARAAGDLKTARRAALSAIGLEPGRPEHWQTLAEIYLKEKRTLASKRMRREAARLTAVQRGGGG